jgi:hypothetical protein
VRFRELQSPNIIGLVIRSPRPIELDHGTWLLRYWLCVVAVDEFVFVATYGIFMSHVR